MQRDQGGGSGIAGGRTKTESERRRKQVEFQKSKMSLIAEKTVRQRKEEVKQSSAE